MKEALEYLQEALQNEHYIKILKKVIMTRHPKAKSYKEAMGMEINTQFFHMLLGGSDDINVGGRSITLKDVLDITDKYIHFDKGTDYTLNNHAKFARNWLSYKPLHEQTPETWEAISNLIRE
jgi:hypothetical protein